MLLSRYFAASTGWQAAHWDDPTKRPAEAQYLAPAGTDVWPNAETTATTKARGDPFRNRPGPPLFAVVAMTGMIRPASAYQATDRKLIGGARAAGRDD
jgi:hypothetical protein